MAASLVSGALFLWSGLNKVARPYDFLMDVYRYELVNAQVGLLVAMALPWLEVILGMLTVLLVSVGTALAQDAPTRRQQIQAIDKQLASGDVNELHCGVAAIDAAIALDRFMAIEGSGFRIQEGAKAQPGAMTKPGIRSPNQ